ncbi:MAG: response regulator [Deltaproteobacteria bacterium]|nr:response regulator [Deltaproteobacteria bacterium]
MKLLIAEDHTALQKTMEMMMKAWGFDFDLASNGQEAVNEAKRNKGAYDLCIMDVEMPIMDGCEATRIMRRDLSYFPIMAYSGNHNYREECFQSGADDFVEKPCSPPLLLAKIRELAVKTYQFVFNGKDLLLKKEMPMDQQHAKELIELKKQGLVKMRLDGPADREIIAHKNTPNKISHDFVVKKQLMSEFLNRDPEKPTLCDLYRGHKNCIVETFIDEEAYAERLKAEDEDMNKHTEKVFKGEEE